MVAALVVVGLVLGSAGAAVEGLLQARVAVSVNVAKAAHKRLDHKGHEVQRRNFVEEPFV